MNAKPFFLVCKKVALTRVLLNVLTGSLVSSCLFWPTTTYAAVNVAPSFTKGANVTVREDSGAKEIVKWATNLKPGPAAESGQSLTFLVSHDNDALFSVPPTISPVGTLTFTVAGPDINGIAKVTVQLQDNGGTADGGKDTSAAQTFTITVQAVNDLPSFTKGADESVLEDSGKQTVPRWATELNAGPANEASQKLSFVVTADNRALFAVPPTINAEGTLTYTPATNATGVATVSVKIQDNGGTANGGVGTSAAQTFTITVNPVNDAPSFTKGANVIVLEDSGAKTIAKWATNIKAGSTNETSQKVAFQVSNNNEALFAVSPALSSDGTLTFTGAGPNINGTATVTVQLQDDGGTADGGKDTSVSQTFTITVQSVNDAPSFTKGPDESVWEDAGKQTVLRWATELSAGPANEATQKLSFVVTNNFKALFAVPPAVSADGTLTYTPATNATGVATVSVKIQDDGGVVSGGNNRSEAQTFTIMVNPINDPPSFVKGGDVKVLEDSGAKTVTKWATAIKAGPTNEIGQKVTFLVSADNASLFDVPPAISVDGTLTFTLAGAQVNGSAKVTVQLQDDGGTADGGKDLSVAQVLTITVQAVNDPPSFTRGPDQSVWEDAGKQTVANWATDLSAGTDNETGQKLTFLVSHNNPALFTVQPAISADGTLTYTPALNATGPALVTVKLQDSGGTIGGGSNTSVAQTFTITVNPINDAPNFTGGSNVVVPEDSGAKIIPKWATDIKAGPINEALQTLAFLVSNDHETLFSVPPAISPDGTLTFTPAGPDINGAARVTVQLQDDGGTADGGKDTSTGQTFTITVLALNDAPSFTEGSDENVLEDAGKQTVAKWATELSPGPANEATQKLSFLVNANNKTLFAVPPSISPDGTLTYTPATNATGVATVTVKIQDDGGLVGGGTNASPARSFTITIHPVNDAPSFIKGSDVTVPEESSAKTLAKWATNIKEGPANEVSQTVAFRVSTDNEALFAVPPAISPDGTLTFTPAGSQMNGAAKVTVELQDDGGTENGGKDTSMAQTFTITVLPVNDPPSFVKGEDQSVLEDSGKQIVLRWATELSAGSANEATQLLSFVVTNNNPVLFGVAPFVSPDGTLTYTPATNATGLATVTVKIIDNGGAVSGGINTSVAQTFTITVNPVNDAPSFVKGLNVTALEDSGAQSIAKWATLIKAGPLNEASQAVAFLVTTDNEALFAVPPAISLDGTLAFTPVGPNLFGTAQVTVQLQDNGGTSDGGKDTSAAQTFTVTVLAVNDPPSFTKGPDQSVMEDAGKQTVANWATDLSVGPANESTQKLTFLVTHNNKAIFVVPPAISPDGTLTYTPAAGATGVATMTVKLFDDGGIVSGGTNASAEQTFTITVSSINDAPNFAMPPALTVPEDAGPKTITKWATNIKAGPPNESAQKLTFLVETEPASLFSVAPTINTDGTLTFTPLANASGLATMTVQLKDDGGTDNGGNDTSATVTSKITIQAVNDPPEFTLTATTVTAGRSTDRQSFPLATGMSSGPGDEAAQTLTFIVTAANPALFAEKPAIDPATGTLTFKLVANASGSSAVSVKLQDNGGVALGGKNQSEAKTFTISLSAPPANTPPTISNIADQTVNEDTATASIPFTVNDAETAAGSLVVTATSSNQSLVSNSNLTLGGTGTTRSLIAVPSLNQNGTTTITVSVSDGTTTATDTFVLTVQPVNDAPTVNLTSPSSGATFVAPATITVAADVADIDGTVARVDFYDGATLIGSDTSAPFQTSWTIAGAGAHTLAAKATDNLGATTTSIAASITVTASSTRGFIWAKQAGDPPPQSGQSPVSLLEATDRNLSTPAPRGVVRKSTLALASTEQSRGNRMANTKAIALDPAGNIYVTGEFGGIATFDDTTLNSTGGLDIFIAKYNSSSNLVWIRQAGGEYAYSNGIAVDAEGNSYITGQFEGNATFGVTTLNNDSGWNAFVAKYDTTGQLVWLRQSSGTSVESGGNSIALDSSRNVYVTGQFDNDFGFDTTSLAFANGHLFLAKWNVDGALQWIKQAGQSAGNGALGLAIGQSVAVDSSANTYVTGQFFGAVRLGETILTGSPGYSGLFVAKYSSSGNLVWVQPVGGSPGGGISGSVWAGSVAVDATGNSYVTGQFQGQVRFGGTTLISPASSMFIAKHNASGSLEWVKRGGAVIGGGGIAVDSSGASYVSGFSFGSFTFENLSFTNSGSTNGFVVSYDNGGNLRWVKQATLGRFTGTSGVVASPSADGGGKKGVAVDSSGNCFVTAPVAAKYQTNGDLIWSKQQAGTDGHVRNGAITVDATGNSYVSGQLSGTTMSFGGIALTNMQGADLFIAKISASGSPVWIRQGGRKTSGYGYPGFLGRVGVDSSGNIYLAGLFEGSVTFGSTTLSTFNPTDSLELFLAKYDATGNLIWARQAARAGIESGIGSADLAVDSAGNSYVAGSFVGNATFGATTLNQGGLYLAKYDTSGNLAWVRQAQGVEASGNIETVAMAIDSGGSAYLTGRFSGSVAFGSTSATSVSDADAFLAKYSVAGNLLWIRQAHATSDGGTLTINGLAVDPSGNASLWGDFYGTVVLGGLTLVGPEGFGEHFLAKYNSAGTPVWAKQIGDNSENSTGEIEPKGVAMDSSGNTILTGLFRGANVVPIGLTSPGYSDLFVAKFDRGGNFLWAEGSAGIHSATVESSQVVVDSLGNSYVSGDFHGRIAFGQTTLMSVGEISTTDLFITKLGPGPAVIDTTSPLIVNVAAPGDGTYLFGQSLDFIVSFSEPVSITGSPGLALTIGAAGRNASYVSGSDTTALLFLYAIRASDAGIVAIGAIALNGGTIRDEAGHDATVTFTPPNTSNLLVEGTSPSVPNLSVDDVVVTEGNSGVANAVFTVSMTGSNTQTVSVQYATANGTGGNPATAGSDYTAVSGTLTWNPGDTATKTITVPVLNDSNVESDESFVVSLSNPVSATIARVQGIGTISNDDSIGPASVMLVKDVNLAPKYSDPWISVELNGVFFGSADNARYGRELWRTDFSVGGTTLVKDIQPGSSGSDIQEIVKVNHTLFFAANDGVHGLELWKSDGTAAGTVLVKDIRPGFAGSRPGSFGLVNGGGILLFSADDGVHGHELWRSDGTADGTVLVSDISPGGGNSFPSQMVNVNGEIFFSATDGVHWYEIWKSDGTVAGTVPLRSFAPGLTVWYPEYLVNVNGTVFFSGDNIETGRELWKTDGTLNGTGLVRDLTPGPDGSGPMDLVNVNGTLFFIEMVQGALWKSDGTAGGTILVKGDLPGEFSSSWSVSEGLANLDGTLLFQANDSIHGNELWKSDGTVSGTILLKDISPNGSGYPHWIWPVGNGKAVFVADDGVHGHELWTTDGTSEGTRLVQDIYPGPDRSVGGYHLRSNGLVYFGATDGIHEGEIWSSDGTIAEMVPIKEAWQSQSTMGSFPCQLVNIGQGVLFKAKTPSTGRELWKTDGTSEGTTLVKDIRLGPNASFFTDSPNLDGWEVQDGCFIAELNGTALFYADDGIHGNELWKSDGTPNGTVLVKDIKLGADGSEPPGTRGLLTINGDVFFAATDGVNGAELWRSDGTENGTVLVKDLWPGASDSFPQNFVNVNGTLFFTANDGVHGLGLWKSDGTGDGTVFVMGIGWAYPANFVNMNGVLFFIAQNAGEEREELWRTDGTPDGTFLVSNVSFVRNLTKLNGTLFFTAYDPVHGGELWKSDGTSGGTVMVKDIRPGTNWSDATALASVNGVMLLRANDGVHGPRLWKSDGTENGTVLLKDISPGEFVKVNGTLFFSASDDLYGAELWKTDGTAEGTTLVADIMPGNESSSPMSFVPLNGKLIFAAQRSDVGGELFSLDISGGGSPNQPAEILATAGKLPERPAAFPMKFDLRNGVTDTSTTLRTAISDRVFRVSVSTVDGQAYVLEYKNSLAEPVWTPITSVAGDGTTKVLSDPAAPTAQRFYRVRVE